MSNEKDVKNFINALSKKVETVNTKIGKAVADSCMVVQREAVKGMTETKVDTEKSYYTHNKKIAHHPSLPNNYPAVDTGDLRKSITFDVKEEGNKTVGRVGSTILDPPYPLYLEYGTSKMKPRKWLQPSLEKSRDTIQKLLREAIK